MARASRECCVQRFVLSSFLSDIFFQEICSSSDKIPSSKIVCWLFDSSFLFFRLHTKSSLGMYLHRRGINCWWRRARWTASGVPFDISLNLPSSLHCFLRHRLERGRRGGLRPLQMARPQPPGQGPRQGAGTTQTTCECTRCDLPFHIYLPFSFCSFSILVDS